MDHRASPLFASYFRTQLDTCTPFPVFSCKIHHNETIQRNLNNILCLYGQESQSLGDVISSLGDGDVCVVADGGVVGGFYATS